MFPKILHQTWKTKNLTAVPEFDACANSWTAHHPEYEYRLWDDRENRKFVKTAFPAYYETWTSFDKNIKRIDTIRYMWMYKYGGIYADLDMECLRSLDPLIQQYADDDAILFCDLDASGRCLSANPALIVSKPGIGLWLEILAYAQAHRDRYVTECTGPIALGCVVNSHEAGQRIRCLDQNLLFIRKHRKSFYSDIPGNEQDYRIYRDVFCTTAKPPKFYRDRQIKYVADWHGTPAQFRWHNEYAAERQRAKRSRGFLSRMQRIFHFGR